MMPILIVYLSFYCWWTFPSHS